MSECEGDVFYFSSSIIEPYYWPVWCVICGFPSCHHGWLLPGLLSHRLGGYYIAGRTSHTHTRTHTSSHAKCIEQSIVSHMYARITQSCRLPNCL